jgi:hypothetical protein
MHNRLSSCRRYQYETIFTSSVRNPKMIGIVHAPAEKNAIAMYTARGDWAAPKKADNNQVKLCYK